ncbi:MAG: DUF3857 domain-containing protein [Caulobacteraceae bacterium]
MELPTERLTADQSMGGRCALLSDTQINLTGSDQVVVHRTIYEVTSSEGLTAAANHNFDFEPSFQSLMFHHVRVIRATQVREIDPTQGLELLRRERQLERAIFDGRLTAYVSIPDVRVGDIIDVCFSTIGAHPTLGGRFSAEFVLSWQCWVGEARLRLISRADRPMCVETWNNVPDCEVEEGADKSITRTWRARRTAPVALEPYVPGWIRLFATVKVSDRMSWAEVAERFRGYYRPEPLPAELEGSVEAIANKKLTAAETVVQALHLVQGELRNQAVTIGEVGFAPRSLGQIWSTRTGDCKDASRLLTAVLDRLGIAAEPVLVHTARGPELIDEAPSLVAFNHCIVGVTLNGRRYWLDPTLFPQGGTLDVLCQARFGWGLPLREDALLEDMGEESLADSFHISEVYELPEEFESPGKVQVTTTLFGWRADATRRRLAAGFAAYSSDLAKRFSQRYESATELAPLKVVDGRDANRVDLVETIELGRVWRVLPDGRVKFETTDELFRPNLPALSKDGRKWPITLGRPLRATSVIEIHLPISIRPTESDKSAEMRGIRATHSLKARDGSNRILVSSRSLTVERPFLEAGETRRFAEWRDDLLLRAGLWVRAQVRSGRIVSTPPSPADDQFSSP